MYKTKNEGSPNPAEGIKICRTCLNEKPNMKSLFSFADDVNSNFIILDVLKTCANIQVFPGDGLPESICDRCTEQMTIAYSFRQLCEKSEKQLKQYFLQKHKSDNNVEMHAKYNEEDKSFNEKGNQDEGIDEVDSILVKDVNYSCSVCHLKLRSFKLYSEHIEKEHKENFQCGQCTKMFSSSQFLQKHIQSMHAQFTEAMTKETVVKKIGNLTTCDICSKTFRFHSNLEAHKFTHTGEKPYLCNVCGKGFAQSGYLKIHSFTHTGEKPYKCQMCDKSFAAPGTLVTHVRTHTGERPHVCKLCGKDFPQHGTLSAHMRTHTGEKPVQCNVCNRRFNQRGRLIIHMRMHSGEKPYQCTECGKSFSVKGTLKKHMRTHTGERPYICKICGQGFAQTGTLATHMKIHKTKV